MVLIRSTGACVLSDDISSTYQFRLYYVDFDSISTIKYYIDNYVTAVPTVIFNERRLTQKILNELNNKIAWFGFFSQICSVYLTACCF